MPAGCCEVGWEADKRFREEVENMPDGDFKNFVLENMNKAAGDDERKE